MDYSKHNIGVLALQGDYQRHAHQLRLLGCCVTEVRLASDLAEIDALIIPGGESTTMNILIDRFGLREPLIGFGSSKPIYGTCAGMIMLAKHIEDNQAGVKPLGLIDIDVLRTGYGRQIHSIEREVTAELGRGPEVIKASFIRAPVVIRVGRAVEVLARDDKSPLLVSTELVLAGSFHTELDDDTTLLDFFVRRFVARR